jgi:hypothetical protein
MPSPTLSDVHVNQPLTNVSVAFIQDATNFVATNVFPNIPVPKQSDRYYTYDRGNFNRDEMQVRAPGTESAGGGYTVDNTPTYYCETYAYHRDIADPLRANADNPLNLDREATVFVTTKALIRREKLWTSSFFTGSIWTNDYVGVSTITSGPQFLKWSGATATPIQDIRTAKRTILQSTGFEPNKLVLGRQVYDALLDAPSIIDRVKYGQTGGSANTPAVVNKAILANLFEVGELVVMNAIENTAHEGAANVHSFIGGNNALLCYATPTPGLMTPTAGYTFSWTGYLGAGADGNRIKMFRMEHLASDRVEIEMSFAPKLVSADLGYFFGSAT